MRSPRPTRLIALLLLLTSLFAVIPASASAQNGANANAANACKHGGWQSLRDSAGTPFPNQGQCVSFAVQGGAFFQEPVVAAPTPTLAIFGGVSSYDGSVAGTGFTPGASVATIEWQSEAFGLGDTYSSRVGDASSYVPEPIDGNGAFTSIATFVWCNSVREGSTYGITFWTLTVTDSTGFSHSQTFDMMAYCGLG